MILNRILKFYQNHKKSIKWFLLIFSALLTGFLYLLFYLYLFHNLKSKGELTYPLYTEGTTGIISELTLFAIRVREMIDGYWNTADPGFYENRNSIAHLNVILPPFVYYVIYLFVGFKYLFAIGDSLLIAAIFVLVFALVYLLTKRYYIGLFFTFMFLMVKDFLFMLFPNYRLIKNVAQIKDLMKAFTPVILHDWGRPDRLNFLVYASTRPGYLFFVPALIFLFLFIKKKTIFYAVLLGISYGLLFYAYPHYWMYMTIVFGLLGSAYLFKKNFTDLKRLIFSGGIALSISIFYWIDQIKLRSLPQFQDIVEHAYVIEYGHNFLWSYWLWYLLCLLIGYLIYIYAKKRNRMYLAYYFILLLLAGFIGLNMQMVIGFAFAAHNWPDRVMFFPIFLASAVLFTWFFEGMEKNNKLIKKIVITFMIILVIFQITGAVQGQAVLAEDREREYTMEKGVAESLIWIDRNLPKDSVFLTPVPGTNYSLEIYTSGRTFIQYPFADIASRKERTERLYAVYSFFQITPETFEKNFTGAGSSEGLQLVILYGQFIDCTYFDEGNIGEKKAICAAEIEKKKQEIFSGYRNYKLDLAQISTKYKIDYIYYEPADKELTDVNFDKFDYLEKIYSNDGGVSVYKFIPEKISSK